MFSGSLRQNIAFDPAGLGGDDGVHRQAIRLAALEDDVAGFPQGLDTADRRVGRPDLRRPAAAPRVGPRPGGGGASRSRAPRPRRSLLGRRRRDRSGHRRLAPARVRARGAAGGAGHHRPVLASPGGLPARRHRARARAGRGRGNGHACRSPRGRRSLRAHLPGAARRRIAARWSRHGDDRSHGPPPERQRCPRAGVPASGESAGAAAGLGGAGGAPRAGRRRRRAGPAARHSRHRRSPSDRWPVGRLAGARAALPARRSRRCRR